MAATPQHAIQAAKLTGLKIGGVAITGIPLRLDLGSIGEDSADVLVRTLA